MVFPTEIALNILYNNHKFIQNYFIKIFSVISAGFSISKYFNIVGARSPSFASIFSPSPLNSS